MSDCDEWLECTPPEFKEEVEEMKLDLLPSKSKKIYEDAYETFFKWKREHKRTLTTESVVMAYFSELSKKYKPSTLWSQYSMLKATLKMKENVDIDTYHTFKAFMKEQSMGFKSKKSNVFKLEDVAKFLFTAPDYEYLSTKVAFIFGISGACRSNELINIQIKNITKQGDLLLVDLPARQTKKPRTFVIAKEFTKIVQRYSDFRPRHVMTNRYFLNFQRGKCTAQVIGIHKFSRMPKEIAVYLKLDDPEGYTGYAFRKTNIALLQDGASIITLKSLVGWKSSNAAEGKTKKSTKNKPKIDNTMSSAVDCASAGPSEQETHSPPPKPNNIEIVVIKKENSDAQWNANSAINSLMKQNFVFNNCTVIINHKS